MLYWIRKRLTQVHHELYSAIVGSLIVHLGMVGLLVWTEYGQKKVMITIVSQRQGAHQAPLVFSPIRKAQTRSSSSEKKYTPQSTSQVATHKKVSKVQKVPKARVPVRKKSKKNKKIVQKEPLATPWCLPSEIKYDDVKREQEVYAEEIIEKETRLPLHVLANELKDPEAPQEQAQEYIYSDVAENDSPLAQQLQSALTNLFTGIPGIDVSAKIVFTVDFTQKPPQISYEALTGIPAYDMQLKHFINERIREVSARDVSHQQKVSVTLYIS